MSFKTVSVFGCTGSVGRRAIEVLRHLKHEFRIKCLASGSNIAPLIDMAVEFNPEFICLNDDKVLSDAQETLKQAGYRGKLLAGPQAMIELASLPVDVVVAAIGGVAGLPSTWQAFHSAGRILLANKEALVAAGHLFKNSNVNFYDKVLPIDSEHNAIFQIFNVKLKDNIQNITITGSGGPFRTWASDQMSGITPAQACAHPTWSMGPKISVDSSTLMNKVLEVIEAHHLFDLPAECIKILIHPQSIVHGLVEYKDGSTLAHLAPPDMRVPILNALLAPNRANETPPFVKSLNLAALSQLTFAEPDRARFPALALIAPVLAAPPAAAVAMNAANEQAVAAFPAGRLAWLQIVDVIKACLDSVTSPPLPDIASVMAFDSEVRALADQTINRYELSPKPTPKVTAHRHA